MRLVSRHLHPLHCRMLYRRVILRLPTIPISVQHVPTRSAINQIGDTLSTRAVASSACCSAAVCIVSDQYSLSVEHFVRHRVQYVDQLRQQHWAGGAIAAKAQSCIACCLVLFDMRFVYTRPNLFFVEKFCLLIRVNRALFRSYLMIPEEGNSKSDANKKHHCKF